MLTFSLYVPVEGAGVRLLCHALVSAIALVDNRRPSVSNALQVVRSRSVGARNGDDVVRLYRQATGADGFGSTVDVFLCR